LDSRKTNLFGYWKLLRCQIQKGNETGTLQES